MVDEENPGYEMMDIHKTRIAEHLHMHRSRPTIWSKYAWVACYHNYFCGLHSAYFEEVHKINVRDFELSPSLIIDPRRQP